MRNKTKIIFLLAITLIAGYFIVKDINFIDDSASASINTNSIILDNDYNKPFAMINGKEVFLRKSYSQNLKDEAIKYKKDFLNKYEDMLISEGISKKDIGLFIDEKIDNSIKNKLIEELELELIIQDANNKEMISYSEKENMIKEENAHILNEFLDEYKSSITKENHILDKDIYDFIEENDSNLIWHKRISKNYIGKDNAERGNNKTSIVNSEDHKIYEGFNYNISSISPYENLEEEKINEYMIPMEEGEITGIIPNDDYGIEYTVAYLSEKDSDSYEYLEEIKNLMDELYFYEYIKDLFSSNHIEFLIDGLESELNINGKDDSVDYDINLSDSDMTFEDKKEFLQSFIEEILEKSNSLKIKNMDIIEDNTLLYIDKPIRKYANINIDLEIEFIQDLNEEERMAINDFLNEEFSKSIEILSLEDGFSFNEYVNDFSVSFYKMDGSLDEFTGFGYTTDTNNSFRKADALHEYEDYILKEVYDLVKSYWKESNEIELENFGLIDDDVFIKVFLVEEDESKYKKMGNDLKMDLERKFNKDDKFKSYKNDLNIKKVQLKIFSNWYDQLIFEF